MGILHVFHYRWPRLQLEPIHEAQDVVLLEQLKAPPYSLIFCKGKWYTLKKEPYYKPSLLPIDEHKVPKDFKTLALILT